MVGSYILHHFYQHTMEYDIDFRWVITVTLIHDVDNQR